MKQLATVPVSIALAVAAACTGTIPTADVDAPSGGGRAGAGKPGAPTASAGSGGSGPPVVQVDAAACKNAPVSVGAGSWRRLTVAQYRATSRDLLGVDADTTGFLQDTQTGPFATNASLPVQSADVDHYADAAAAIAAKAAADPTKLLAGCDAKTTGEDACAARFIDDFGLRAFRRPLSAAEKTAFLTVYAAGKEDGFARGLGLVVEAALQAPSFLYLVEANGATPSALHKLGGYELAARLSYLLWGTMPDATLFAAAKAGKLDDVAGVRDEATRMLADRRFVDAAAAFHAQLLGVTALGRDGVVTKDTKLYPDFDATMRAAMQAEPGKFVAYVLGPSGDGTVRSLLAGPYAFPTGPLMKVYGVSAGQLASDGHFDVKDGTRAGLLTQASTMAAHPQVPTPYRAVNRGHVVREDLLCQGVPPPMQAVKFELPAGAEKMTQQDLLRAHQQNPTCKGCHSLMDSIGFGLEAYDFVGKLRTTDEAGRPLDTSGELASTDVDGAFAGPKQLAEKLASSAKVRECLAGQWFRFALARQPADDDGCSLLAVQTTLKDGDGDVRKAVLSLVASDAFRHRRGE
jgi:hypothetical protein